MIAPTVTAGVLWSADSEVQAAYAQARRHAAMIREGLKAREIEVLEGMADGLTNAQIAARLGLAENTVKGHAQHLLGKLGATCRTHAVSIAFRKGWLA